MRTVSCVNPLYVLGKEVLGGREAGGPHAQGPGGAGLSAPDPVCAPDHGSAPTSLPTDTWYHQANLITRVSPQFPAV